MVPAGEVLEGLVPAPEDDAGGSVRDLADDGNGHLDAPGQLVYYRFWGGDQELVVLANRRRRDLGVTAEGGQEPARIARYGERPQVHPASDPAPLADAARVRGETIREVYHGAHPHPGRGAPRLHPRLGPQ